MLSTPEFLMEVQTETQGYGSAGLEAMGFPLTKASSTQHLGCNLFSHRGGIKTEPRILFSYGKSEE